MLTRSIKPVKIKLAILLLGVRKCLLQSHYTCLSCLTGFWYFRDNCIPTWLQPANNSHICCTVAVNYWYRHSGSRLITSHLITPPVHHLHTLLCMFHWWSSAHFSYNGWKGDQRFCRLFSVIAHKTDPELCNCVMFWKSSSAGHILGHCAWPRGVRGQPCFHQT